MYGKKNGDSPKATATIIISEPKILDLSSLLNRKNGGVSFTPPTAKTSSPAPIFATKAPITISKPTNNVKTNSPIFASRAPLIQSKPTNNLKINSPIVAPRSPIVQSTSDFRSKILDRPFNSQLNALLQKAATSNDNGNSFSHLNSNHLLDLLNGKKPRTWNSRLCFSNDYIYFKDNRITTREFGESGVQFKCTYQGCNKRLSTNINFIHHVWAHAKNVDSTEPSNGALYNIVYGIGDVGHQINEQSKLQCIECLAEFTSTQKLHKHQFHVHRFGTQSNTNEHPVCHICEKEVDMANVDKHAMAHGEFEMPFECPLCGWRSSSRQALLFHFERTHNANTTLICPFCLEKFSAKRPSAVKSQRNIFTSHNFVEHLLEHFQDGGKKSNCSRCVLKYCADSFTELTEKLKLHSEMHRSASKLKFERKSLRELFITNLNQRTADVKALSPVCFDCGYRIKSFDSHYRRKQACENANCPFETRCRIAFKQHEVLCPMKDGDQSTKRLPFGKNNLINESPMNSMRKERVRLRCSMCLFATKDPSVFNDHLIKECVGAKPLLGQKNKLGIPRKRELSEDERQEINLFGLHLDVKRFKLQNPRGFFEQDPDKQPNWLSKVVPFIADKNLVVFKKNAIVKSVSIVDETNSSATNDFFSVTKFFCQEQDEKRDENIAKLAHKICPPSRFPQRQKT